MIISNCHGTGLGSTLRLQCAACGQSGSTSLSRKIGRSYDVNRRSVLAMRYIGRGHNGLRKFLRVMNFPAPATEKAYLNQQKAILAAATKVAESDMVQSATGLLSMAGSNQVSVTFDGTWMRRVYSSLYGVFACISFKSGRVLDLVVKGRYCHECKIWTEKK